MAATLALLLAAVAALGPQSASAARLSVASMDERLAPSEEASNQAVVKINTQWKCCCKENKCRKGAIGDDGKKAQYTANDNLCCKFKKFKCRLDVKMTGYKIEAPDPDYCAGGGHKEPSFDAPSNPVVPAPREDDFEEGTPEHTVHTYCELGPGDDLETDGEEMTASRESAEAATKARRNEIISSLVSELSKNSLDAMAKEIFSVYACVRWAPTKDFVRLADNEVETKQLPSGSSAYEHYSKYRFMPLRCTQNINVYGKGTKAGETHFEHFETHMSALGNWFRTEAGKFFNARLTGLAGLTGPALVDSAGLFDMGTVSAAVAKCKGASQDILVNSKSATVEELLGDCGFMKWWMDKLQNWHSAMPFTSFMAPGEQAASLKKPEGEDQVLICFGKRVASQLHRREGGSHLMTDQSAVGCHGFWKFDQAATMLRNIVMLWRPPTCKLAAMELDMKIKILDLIAEMNTHLFDAMPAILMDDAEKSMVDSDGHTLKRGGAGTYLMSYLGSISSVFAKVKSKYTRLGEMLGNTVVKWAVCPLRPLAGPEEADRLDSVLGTEDDVARWYAEQAFKKWTGREDRLPGETCTAMSQPLGPRCTMCSLGTMQEDMPEPYKQESFICPVRPLLQVNAQLDVLRKKAGMCIMHMTNDQWVHKDWIYHGRAPHKKQYNSTANAPTGQYEIIKILNTEVKLDDEFRLPRTFVSYARRCTEEEFAATPRWCSKPQVGNEQSSSSHGGTKAAAAAGHAVASVAGAAGTAIVKSLEVAGVKKETPPPNKALGKSISSWFYGVSKGIERGVKGAWARHVGRASGRYGSLHWKMFNEVEAGELLHSASFQKELAKTGADSKGKMRYDRFAVVCPCPDFDPNREFKLRYQWGEKAIRLALKAEKEFNKDGRLFKQNAFKVQLQAAAVLGMSDNAHAWIDSSAHVRAGGVGEDFPEWYKTTEPFLNEMVGSSHTRSYTSISGKRLYGLQATFACGKRTAMHGLDFDFTLPNEKVPLSFGDCVEKGKEANLILKHNAPGKLFFEEETVVRVTFSALGACYHESFTKDANKPKYKPTVSPTDHPKRNFYEAENPVFRAFDEAGSGCQAVNPSLLPEYLSKAKEKDTYRGMLAGSGLPKDTLLEVVLDPADLAAELETL